MSRYHVGDRVKVRNDLKIDEAHSGDNGNYKDSFVSDMSNYTGKVVTISEVISEGRYSIEEDEGDWNWVDDMFDGLVEPHTEPHAEPHIESHTAALREFDTFLAENDAYTGKMVCIDTDDDECISIGDVFVVSNGEAVFNGYRLTHITGVSSVQYFFSEAQGCHAEFIPLREAVTCP